MDDCFSAYSLVNKRALGMLDKKGEKHANEKRNEEPYSFINLTFMK